jgi:hypothetical protein
MWYINAATILYGHHNTDTGFLNGNRESNESEDTALCKIQGIERINRGEELEREWPLLEAIRLIPTTYGGG